MTISQSADHRLFVDAPLAPGAAVPLGQDQSHYLRNVLRLGIGDRIRLFNGRDGEWSARIAVADRRGTTLSASEQLRSQTPPGAVDYAFAPLKSARLDYLAQKAVEMGAGSLAPVRTRRTQVTRVNLERIRANVIEAAEQCGVLSVPVVGPEQSFDAWLAGLPRDQVLVFCDEEAAAADPLAALAAAPEGRITVLVGPEGGFDPAERRTILARRHVVQLRLGPRIMRADTAAVAVLALVQAARGDWRPCSGPGSAALS